MLGLSPNQSIKSNHHEADGLAFRYSHRDWRIDRVPDIGRNPRLDVVYSTTLTLTALILLVHNLLICIRIPCSPVPIPNGELIELWGDSLVSAEHLDSEDGKSAGICDLEREGKVVDRIESNDGGMPIRRGGEMAYSLFFLFFFLFSFRVRRKHHHQLPTPQNQ